MLKKLQNLLFEEEDEDIDEETEVEETVRPAVQEQQRVERPVAQPVKEQPLKQVQPVEEKLFPEDPKEEPVEEPSFDSIFQEEKKPEEKKQPLGITLDREEKPKPVEEKKEPVRKPSKKAIKPEKPAPTSSYQFKPVISPIFGVDEKDLTAVKNTARRYSTVEKTKTDMNVTPIISPMYGSNAEDSMSLIGDTVERSEILEKTVGNLSSVKAEDDIPEFSLDDILSGRDEEYREEVKAESEDSTADFAAFFKKEETDDETKVIDRTLFPSDEGLD